MPMTFTAPLAPLPFSPLDSLPEIPGGRALATAGIVFGCIGLAPSLLALVMLVAVSA
jgi:hypothetical protein